MQIQFKQLTLHNFKSHKDLLVTFGTVTTISGENAQGKSSIGDGPTWIMYSLDALGNKLDPTPINYEFDEVRADLLLEVDGTPFKLSRGIVKGSNKFWINDVPAKATEFDSQVAALFEKDVFMSLFSPTYFFGLHWEKQRALLLRFVTAPANKEVFAKMEKLQADKLAELVKKHTLADLEKLHKENKTKKEKENLIAQGRTKTLQEQLRNIPTPASDPGTASAENTRIMALMREIEMITDKAGDNNTLINSLQTRISNLKNQIQSSRERFPALRDEAIQDTCRTCKQSLNEEAVEAVKADKEKRIEAYKLQHDGLIAERKKLEAELAELEFIDVSEQLAKLRELDAQRQPYVESLRIFEEREYYSKQLEEAKAAEAATLASKNESIFILDAIKAFNAKEAELQAAKVQALFTTLSLRLFKENKGDGELKPDFEMVMDGKPYSRLSLSEGIKAGLELRDVLSEQSGIIMPCFIDNGESITRFRQPLGQLIVSRVVADRKLTIESDEK